MRRTPDTELSALLTWAAAAAVAIAVILTAGWTS